MKNKIRAVLKKKKVIAAILVLGAVAIAVGSTISKKTVHEKIIVKKGVIAEEVSVTGKTKPLEEVSLAFERGGRVTHIYGNVGDHATAGQALIALDASELVAQLAQAKASVETQNAKLDELKRGTREEDLEVKRAELRKAEQDLKNYYESIPEILNDAYTKADDALRKQTNGIFSGDEEVNPQLTFTSTDSQAASEALNQRIIAGQRLNKWKKELLALSPNATETELNAALASGKSALETVRVLLNRIMDIVISINNLPSATATTYKANITTARTNINTVLTSLNSQEQSIASQNLTVKRINNELQLKLAGTISEQLAAQEAQVRSAEAQVQLIQAQIAKTALISPIEGVITKQDAKRGEIIGANIALVSIISQNKLEIEANVPEVDIGKVALGNPVRITIDALPGEEFGGKVIHLDPAETIVDGVVNYKVKILFTKADARIKSGLTTNLDIRTVEKTNILLLPQYALLENDKGVFVKKQNGEIIEEIPVIIGIRSQDGNVEIISGVAEGDEVLNIGAKTE